MIEAKRYVDRLPPSLLGRRRLTGGTRVSPTSPASAASPTRTLPLRDDGMSISFVVDDHCRYLVYTNLCVCESPKMTIWWIAPSRVNFFYGSCGSDSVPS